MLDGIKCKRIEKQTNPGLHPLFECAPAGRMMVPMIGGRGLRCVSKKGPLLSDANKHDEGALFSALAEVRVSFNEK